ncbi:MAG: PD40 domain-containing protein [Candidatus Krumholzibacteriota bacterium]|nr:PD40 domain-containing protein [Candidatus Krumholzibacteriota bacterium]
MRSVAIVTMLVFVLASAMALIGCGDSPAGGGGGDGDTDPPLVSITSPLEGEDILSIVNISGTATDGTGVDTVYFEVTDLCGVTLWSDTDATSPYGVVWDAAAAQDGNYRVCMAAKDDEGNISDWTCVTVVKGIITAEITGFFPHAVYGGREIMAIGSGFGTNTGTVSVFGYDAVVNDWTDTTVTFVMPGLVPEETIVSMELLIDCRWRVQSSVDVTSSGIIRLTNNVAEEMQPCWSADGTYVYFASARTGNWDIWRISIDGTVLQQVASSPDFDAMPAVNPSSGEVAWVSNRNHLGNNPDGDYEIFTGFSCGAGAICTMVMFTNDNDNNNTPAWSPSVHGGYSLLYTQFYDPEDDGTTVPIVFMYSVSGTDSIGAGMAGCFSGDGQWVVYQDNNYQIRKKQIGTVMPIVLTRGQSDFNPDWGRANNRIVFTRYYNGYPAIFVMEADGSNAQPLIAHHGIYESEAKWSPDCSMIAYKGHRTGNSDIYVYEVP